MNVANGFLKSRRLLRGDVGMTTPKAQAEVLGEGAVQVRHDGVQSVEPT